MARYRRGKKHRHHSAKPSVAVIGGLAGSAIQVVEQFTNNNGTARTQNIIWLTSGMTDGGWDYRGPMKLYTPIVAGVAIHYLAGKVGINRRMGKLPVRI